MNAISNALAETLFIIRCLPCEEQNRISKNFIKILNENKNENYVVNINPNINLENQELLDETKELLKEIYMTYFVSNETREKIIRYDNYRSMIERNLKN